MFPPIPEKLWKIDESTAGEHFSLREGDLCFYIWEYTAAKGFSFSPTNHLISNLKIKPGQIAKTPGRHFYKERAINHAAAGLRHLFTPAYVASSATFVPIPGSKVVGDPEHDARMHTVLQRAFQGWSADIRSLLKLTQSTPADHETTDRLSFEELLAISELVNPAGQAVRPIVIVVDDVLNSGKHFKVAQTLLSARFPGVRILGLFLARCVHERPIGDIR